jgi:hypothetical protein
MLVNTASVGQSQIFHSMVEVEPNFKFRTDQSQKRYKKMYKMFIEEKTTVL